MAKNKKQNGGKGSVVGCVIGMIFFFLLGAVMLIGESDYLFSEPQDLNEMVMAGDTPQKGEYVTVGVDAVVDWYAETEHRINGIIPIGKEQHCLVWLDDESFISMTVKGKNMDKVDELIEETSDYLNGVSDTLPSKVVFSGRISAIDSDVSKYYDDVLDYYGIYESDGLVVRNITIDTTDTKLQTWLIFGFFMLLGVVFLVTLVITVKNKKKEKAAQAVLAGQTPYFNPMQPGVDAYGNPVQPGANTYGNSAQPGVDAYGNPIQPGTDAYGNPTQPGTDAYGNMYNPGANGQNMPYNDNNNNLYS